MIRVTVDLTDADQDEREFFWTLPSIGKTVDLLANLKLPALILSVEEPKDYDHLAGQSDKKNSH